MENDYSKLLNIQARTPEKLKELLVAIPVPSLIMQGSWYNTGGLFGVWVYLDRSVEKVKMKDLKTPKFDVKEQPKTTILKKEG